ncbi:MAG: HAMP domain-containing sensor histidine kinase [Clostridia bacterium]
MRKNDYPIEKKLRLYLYMTLFLYTIIGLVCILVLEYVFSLFKYPIIEWIYLRMDVIYILYLVIGFSGIFYYYWKKPWTYLNEIVKATQTIYEQDSHTIELSEPLRDIESQMNQIKMSVLLSKQAAKEAEDKKNELVMYLAHDIRTPLTTVIGYLSLLSEASDMPAEQKAKYVDIALDKAERLEKLINELFEITRYNTKTVTLKKEKIDLYCLLVQLIDEFYPALSAKGNTASLDADEKLLVNADPEKLARVFNNILNNAAAYSYPNTEIKISTYKQDANIVVVIQNHGKTIPEGQLKEIFKKFNRLDEARLSDTGGTGLGLSIAEEIIHLHDGTIKAESKNDTIIFTVTLPLAT